MNKFNLPRRNIQKERRAKRAERRKNKASTAASKVSSSDALSNSSTVSLKVSSVNVHSGYLSGKNKSKLQKRWRRAQKEALQSGLISMQDIEMMAVDEEGGSDQASVQPKLPKSARAFSMKKRAKVRSKSSVSKEDQVRVQVASSNAGAEGEDAMMQ